MLQSIRDKASGWLAYVIIGLIAIPFALWGLGEYFGGAGPLVAAEVNGQEIPVRIVHQETRAQREQLARMFGGQIPDTLFDERALREAALESLIQRELLRQAADNAGFRASSVGVVREIRGIPTFWENGDFSTERYHAILQAQRIAPGEFERDVAQSMVLAQVQQAIQATGDLPSAKAESYARLRNQTRVASWTVFSAQSYDTADVVASDAIAAFYEANPDRFTLPEQVQVAYLRLDPAEIESGIDVSDADIREHFEINVAQYTEPELRRVRQILLAAESVDAEARARNLRSRIDAGEEFATLADQYSEDPASADQHGELGLIARGDLDSVLETVIFSLPANLVSQPVQSARGWHILEVTEIRPAQPQPFDAVREAVERDLRDRRAEQRQIQMLDDLLSQTFESPDSLAPAARVTGLEIMFSDWFTRAEGDGVAAVRGIREAAFSPAVLADGRNSIAVDLPDGSTIVLRIHERRPPSQQPLEAVTEEIRALLQRDAAAEAAMRSAQVVFEQLESGVTVAELAAAEDALPWAVSVPVQRSSNADTSALALPQPLREKIFRMPAPQDDIPLREVVALPGGDAAVVVLEAVQTVAVDGVIGSDALREAAERLQAAVAAEEMRAYLAWLEAEAKIVRHARNLE